MSRHPAARLLEEAGPTMSVDSIAPVLGVCSETVYAMIRRGDLERLGIRVLKLGRSLRIPTADVRRAVGLPPDGPPDERGGARPVTIRKGAAASTITSRDQTSDDSEGTDVRRDRPDASRSRRWTA